MNVFPTHQALCQLRDQRYKVTVQLLKQSSPFSYYSIHSKTAVKYLQHLEDRGFLYILYFSVQLLTTYCGIQPWMSAMNTLITWSTFIYVSEEAQHSLPSCLVEVNVKPLFALLGYPCHCMSFNQIVFYQLLQKSRCKSVAEIWH